MVRGLIGGHKSRKRETMERRGLSYEDGPWMASHFIMISLSLDHYLFRLYFGNTRVQPSREDKKWSFSTYIASLPC